MLTKRARVFEPLWQMDEMDIFASISTATDFRAPVNTARRNSIFVPVSTTKNELRANSVLQIDWCPSCPRGLVYPSQKENFGISAPNKCTCYILDQRRK